MRANAGLSAFLLAVFFLLLTSAVAVPLLLKGRVEPTIGLPLYIVWQLLLSALGILFIKKLQVAEVADFRFKNIGQGFLLGWVALLLAVIMLAVNITSPPQGGFLSPQPLYLLTVIIYPFIVSGLFEEVVFRGLVLKILLRKMGRTKKGIANAIIISAGIFAVGHGLHLLWQPPLTVLSDLIFPLAGGMFLAAIYLRIKTLIVPILLHGLLNLAGMISWAFTSLGPVSPAETTLADIITITLIGALPLIIATFVLLRKVEPSLLTGDNTKTK